MKLKFFGIYITVTFPFVALILFIFAVDKTKTLPLVLLFAFLHEAGHLIAMVLSKNPPKEIVLSLIGASIVWKSDTTLIKELIILISGISVNLILAIVFFITDKPFYSAINLIMGLFNALPIASFDGGRTLKLLLETKFNQITAEKIRRITSLCVLAITVIFAVLGGLLKRVNPTMMITSLYMLIIEISRLKC